MSSVDPKPTYTRTVEAHLVSLATRATRRSSRLAILKLGNIEHSTLEHLDLAGLSSAGTLVDHIDECHEMGADVSEYAELFASTDAIRSLNVNQESVDMLIKCILDFSADCETILIGSAAAYDYMDRVILTEVTDHDGLPSDIASGARFAEALAGFSANICKINPLASAATLKTMHARAANNCRLEFSQRKTAEDVAYHTVSRRVRTNYNALLSRPGSRISRRIFPDGITVATAFKAITGKVRRTETSASDLEYLYAGSVRYFKRNKTLYILSTDNARSIYQVLHRRTMAILAAEVQSAICPPRSYVSAADTRRLTTALVKSAAHNGRIGKPISLAARSMHQIWCAYFTRAYESLQDGAYVANWEARYNEIINSAREMSHMAPVFMEIADSMPENIALDALRLHHIMAAPDTPPDLLASLTADIVNVARAPDEASYRSFLEFVKSYELCMYLYKKRAWPNVVGAAVHREKTCYKKCLRGRFSLPPASDHGELAIHSHFPYIRYADQFCLRAKDATRVPDDKEAAMSLTHAYESWEHNELLHAIKRGNNLGAPNNMSIEEARQRFWDPDTDFHVLIQTAAKAETTKSDCKPRGTFSAVGEFRHMQGEFDRNCQVMNDIIGCGSLRADVAMHAKGMSRVAAGTNQNHITSSHDIEAWSPSQYREAFCKFGAYRASQFKGINPQGWVSSWKCFDSVINKNGFVSSVHLINGGFQGFPGTLDTSLHVLILVYFLWRMKAQGKIPNDVVTLAKATIDDCLAQMGTWNGTMGELESEIESHYMSLGYKIDLVKSIVSACKAIYLNQAMIRGAFVHQAVKVICKLDRPLEIILKTPLEDVAGCFSGAKAAVQMGMDPISAYYIAALLGLSYLARASPKINAFEPEQLAMLCILPRGDGGFGLPTIADLICKEHPDSRAQANHAVYMHAQSKKMMGKEVSKKAATLWADMKHRPFAISSKMSIFFNPRSCTRIGVSAMESVKRSLVIDAARDWAEADPYRGILAMAKSDVLSSLYSAMLRGCTKGLDCSFLEAYTAHLPEKILDSIVGKVTSYRVAKELLGSRSVVSAQGLINSMFNMMVDNALGCQVPKDLSMDMVQESLLIVTGYERTVSERDEFYAANQVFIINHTIPSPFEVLSVVGAHDGNAGVAHIASDIGSLRKYAPDCPDSSHSMVSKHGVAYPFKSKNWVVQSADEYRYLDSVCNTFVEGCAVIEWAKAKGLETAVWEKVYLRRWLGSEDHSTTQYVTHSLQGSIKRSNAAAGDRSHPVFVGQNIQRSVMVSLNPIVTLLENRSYDIDPLSLVASAYAIGTVNLTYLVDAFSSVGQMCGSFAWALGAHPALLVDTKPIEVEVDVSLNFFESLFELELDEMSFLATGGGTQTMLGIVSDPTRLYELITSHSNSVSDLDIAGMNEDMGDHSLPPMLAGPTEAPPAATFLIGPSVRNTVGMLVRDTFTDSSTVRLLEVSPTSGRMCAIAALQEVANDVGAHKFALHAIGSTDQFKPDDIVKMARRIAATTLGTVIRNLSPSIPVYEAAKSMRIAGFAKFTWYDSKSQSTDALQSALVKYAQDNVDEFLSSIRRTASNFGSLGGADYHASSTGVRIAKDPDRANARERASKLKQKYKARAKIYSGRIRLAKSGQSTIKRDMPEKRVEKYAKLAYLAGSKELMDAVEFADGPVLDLDVTVARLHAKICHKIQKHGSEPVVTDYRDLLDDERNSISEDILTLANTGPKGDWWVPRAFTRGVLAGLDWVREDVENERKEVYFVPRTVQVISRVRAQHIFAEPLTANSPRPRPLPKHSRAQSSSSFTIVDGPSANTDSDTDSDFEMPVPGKSSGPPRTAADYVSWVYSITPGQLAVIMLDNDFTMPSGATIAERFSIYSQRGRLAVDSISSDHLNRMRMSAAAEMYRLRMPMVVPDVSYEGPSEDLAE